MDHWSELRTAWLVAKLGTISAAAQALGVHRATVNRHIATLERALGATLFQRHARGYSPTDTGHDMLEVAGRADEMFADLQGRTRGRASQLTGELIVTALAGVAPLVMPAIARFQAAYPAIAVDFVAGAQLARLEYGEAHVAVRAGSKPDVSDYVVLPFRRIRFGIYAHQGYVDRFGVPSGEDDLSGHRFVGVLDEEFRAPFRTWMSTHVPATDVALRASEPQIILQGVLAGLGLGFLAEHDALPHPDLVEVLPRDPGWSAALWIVTHMDLHRTAKVQAFLRCLRATRQ